MNLANMDKILHFQRRLGETIAWCASKDWMANPAERLRTVSLRPSEQASIKQTFPDYGMFWKKTPHQRQQVVEQLAIKRAELLQVQNTTSIQSRPSLINGRLLAFDPGGSTSDGAAEFATQGFFDYDNVPAWDTWITYVTDDPVSNSPWDSLDSYLLSWVPTPLVEMVEVGMDVNWERCILWATDLDTAFIRQLMQAGLVR